MFISNLNISAGMPQMPSASLPLIMEIISLTSVIESGSSLIGSPSTGVANDYWWIKIEKLYSVLNPSVPFVTIS